jgi:thioredoxin reductase (NADPH)|tara:strand:- start:2228 stop:3148 length:921 start_codon:yes stop_codon:yes gene_type:complete
MSTKVIIIGSGPAGLTAALYTARANLQPLVITGVEWGGQLMLTSEVENYPGFVDGINGPDLMDIMKKQAEKFGTEFISGNVTSVDFNTRPFQVFVGDKKFEASSVIIATGASTKWIGLDSEQKFIGKGVSSCATCDGFFFKDKDIAVVGGGDSAMEEALFLTKFANTVKIIHRRDKLRASKIMQERAINNDKIEFVWDSEVVEVLGDDKVNGIKIQNTKNKEISEIKLDGLFVAIGHIPNTDFLKGQINLDELGYVIKQDGTRTNIEGVFVAGDVHDFRYRQAVTAAGHGCEAAMDVEKYLEANDL